MQQTKKRLKYSLLFVFLMVVCSTSFAADSGTQTKEPPMKQSRNPLPLFTTKPQKEDYIKVSPLGSGFVHSNGRPFIPLGYNHNPDWPKFIESDPSRPGYNPKITEDFFAHLARSGVNVVRIMLETPATGGFFENPVGTFVPGHIRWIDNIVTAARHHKIKLLMTPWDTFWMNKTWEKSPYNHLNNGPVVEKIDFLTNREVIETQKKRWKYIIDRWGNSGVVFAWELMNEIDIWWGASPKQVEEWIKEVSVFIRDYEQRKWGRRHLITVSTAQPMPEGILGDVAYRMPGLDFAQTHLYIGASRAPSEPIQPAIDIAHGVRFSLAARKDLRPYIDGEDGPIDKWISNERLDDQVFHNMIWAHLSSGGAGSGFRWPYRHPHHLSEGMYKALSRMSTFVKGAPWTGIWASTTEKPSVKVPNDRIAFSTGGAEAAIVWTTSRGDVSDKDLAFNLTWPGKSVSLKGRAYDTRSGVWLKSVSVKATPDGFQVNVVKAPASVAIILERQVK